MPWVTPLGPGVIGADGGPSRLRKAEANPGALTDRGRGPRLAPRRGLPRCRCGAGWARGDRWLWELGSPLADGMGGQNHFDEPSKSHNCDYGNSDFANKRHGGCPESDARRARICQSGPNISMPDLAIFGKYAHNSSVSSNRRFSLKVPASSYISKNFIALGLRTLTTAYFSACGHRSPKVTSANSSGEC
jgi:hypothetical protein